MARQLAAVSLLLLAAVGLSHRGHAQVARPVDEGSIFAGDFVPNLTCTSPNGQRNRTNSPRPSCSPPRCGRHGCR